MHENLSEYRQIFFNDGYRLGKEVLKKGYDEQALLKAVRQMYDAIDRLIDSLSGMAKQQNHPVHCKRGCEWCCHQAVFAGSHELHYLGNFIKTHFSSGEIVRIRDQAQTKNKHTSKMKEEEILNHKSPCPLLKNGACIAYQARPVACRIYLSTNVDSCLEFFKNPANENNYPALLEFPLHAGRMMNEGFISALRKAGIETAESRLEDGLCRFFPEEEAFPLPRQLKKGEKGKDA